MSKIKVGVIGVGNISNEHIQGYLRNPDVELYAFCDINETQLKKQGEKYGVTRLYTDMNDLLASCKAAGFTPVIAHPERYEAVREDPYIVKNWQELGYGIQVNRDSLMGVFGHRTAQCAMYLLHHRWAGCIASDAHSPHGRNADWRPAFDLFWEHFELPFIDRCLQTRPKEILNLKH